MLDAVKSRSELRQRVRARGAVHKYFQSRVSDLILGSPLADDVQRTTANCDPDEIHKLAWVGRLHTTRLYFGHDLAEGGFRCFVTIGLT